MVGNGGPDSYLVVFVKDNVSVHPTQNAGERISGRLRLIKQGPSLFMVGTLSLYEYRHLGSVAVVETYCAMLLFDVSQIKVYMESFAMVAECNSSILALMFKFDMCLRIVQTWIPYTVQGGGRRGSSVMKSAEKGVCVGLHANVVYVYCGMSCCVFTEVFHFEC